MNLNIHRINKVKKSYLLLEGTILILYEEKGFRGSIQSELQIPLELISVYERFRFKGGYLITSLLFLLVPLLISGILYGIIFEIIGIDDESIYNDVFAFSMLILLLVGFVMFWVFLIKFFIKRETVCLVIAPDGINIEFWRESKSSTEVDKLLSQIDRRKALIEESLVQPANKVVGFVEEHSLLPKFFFLLYIFSLPAMITRELSLTYLLLLPIAWLLYRGIELKKQPREYRRALKSYFNKEYDQAIDSLRSLQERLPEYLPAYMLLVDIYRRNDRFDEALEAASGLPDKYIDIAQNIQMEVWLFKRIYKRRKYNVQEVN